MMAGDGHALAQVEAMRIETLHARIQTELPAIQAPGFRDQPVEQGRAEALKRAILSNDRIYSLAERPLLLTGRNSVSP